MVFSSLQFVLIFLPIFFLTYYLSPCQGKNIILLIGSLIFYFTGTIYHPSHMIVFLLSIIADFATGLMIERIPSRKKLFLVSDLFFHIICLSTFKYMGFILSELKNFTAAEINVPDIILPIGISFYTFQGISYVVDVYRKKFSAEKSLLNFSCYISMFPQLIAGPIVNYQEVCTALSNRKTKGEDILKGIALFIIGLGLKVLLANPTGKLWSDITAIGFESISSPLAWMAAASFSLQIYFDFFGYSLMAMGLGKMMGFDLPVNFDFPYMSLTMTEFWRRWHITLGRWFREYVYIPLRGNKGNTILTLRNLFIVWLLTGIWHGAGYNFIIWGIMLFIIISIEKFFTGRILSKYPILGHTYMIFLIPVTWAVFAIDDISSLSIFFSKLFPFLGDAKETIFPGDYIKYWYLYRPFLLSGLFFSTKIPFRMLKKIEGTLIFKILLAVIFTASIYCMYMGLDDPFLYFRF